MDNFIQLDAVSALNNMCHPSERDSGLPLLSLLHVILRPWIGNPTKQDVFQDWPDISNRDTHCELLSGEERRLEATPDDLGLIAACPPVFAGLVTLPPRARHPMIPHFIVWSEQDHLGFACLGSSLRLYCELTQSHGNRIPARNWQMPKNSPYVDLSKSPTLVAFH